MTVMLYTPWKVWIRLLVLDIAGNELHSWNIAVLIGHVSPLFMW